MGSRTNIRVVGGPVLDLALSQAKPHSRFVMCEGMVELDAS
jgi:hypothetical protein